MVRSILSNSQSKKLQTPFEKAVLEVFCAVLLERCAKVVIEVDIGYSISNVKTDTSARRNVK